MYFGRAHHVDPGQNLPVHLILKVSNFDHPLQVRESILVCLSPRVGHSFGDRMGLIESSPDFNFLRRAEFEQRGCRGVVVYDRQSADGKEPSITS